MSLKAFDFDGDTVTGADARAVNLMIARSTSGCAFCGTAKVTDNVLKVSRDSIFMVNGYPCRVTEAESVDVSGCYAAGIELTLTDGAPSFALVGIDNSYDPSGIYGVYQFYDVTNSKVNNETLRDQQIRDMLATRVQCGTVSIVPDGAGVKTTEHVDFPTTFDGVPMVVVSANSSSPSTITALSTTGKTKSGFDIVLYRSNTTETYINWIAVGKKEF